MSDQLNRFHANECKSRGTNTPARANPQSRGAIPAGLRLNRANGCKQGDVTYARKCYQ
jgi:hypothetical protein